MFCPEELVELAPNGSTWVLCPGAVVEIAPPAPGPEGLPPELGPDETGSAGVAADEAADWLPVFDDCPLGLITVLDDGLAKPAVDRPGLADEALGSGRVRKLAVVIAELAGCVTAAGEVVTTACVVPTLEADPSAPPTTPLELQ